MTTLPLKNPASILAGSRSLPSALVQNLFWVVRVWTRNTRLWQVHDILHVPITSPRLLGKDGCPRDESLRRHEHTFSSFWPFSSRYCRYLRHPMPSNSSSPHLTIQRQSAYGTTPIKMLSLLLLQTSGRGSLNVSTWKCATARADQGIYISANGISRERRVWLLQHMRMAT